MPDHELHYFAVFTRRPDSVSEAEYDAWYRDHLAENLQSPGFVAGQRFAATRRDRSAPEGGTPRHLALYQYRGPRSTWSEHLSERIRTGQIVLPSWFDEIEFRSWECIPLDEPHLAEPVPHSTPPD